jgi:DNA-directed RNA polymerase subunit RPC12/RpoP
MSSKFPIKGKTDLATCYPDVAKQWHPTKNGDLKPEDFKPKSNKKVWWLCPRGDEYAAVIGNRTILERGCPYCSGNIPIKGATDLATCCPDVAKQWHPTKNDDLRPKDFKSQSNKKAWWLCPKGHEYESKIFNRTRGQGCPYCAGNLPIKGENDLTTCYPDVAKQWHPTKNGDLRPEDFKPKSNKKVWWLCPKKHVYAAIVNARTTRNDGCPYCSGRKAIEGETDLETLRPDIAKEWHPTKNGGVKLSTIMVGTGSKHWWLCPEGHEYESTVCDRTRNDRPHGCPYCSGRKPIAGVYDLGTVCKEAYQFWDYDKNNTIPSDYLPNSGAKAWMKCDKGHSWNTTLLLFVRSPKCPYCSGKTLTKGVNTLSDLHPQIAKKWDYKKNGVIDIDKVSIGSSTKYYWWKCESSHSWMGAVHGMVNAKGKGCPYCSGSISKYSI